MAGACLPVAAGALPYLPVVQILRALVRGTERARLPALLGPHREELGRLLPELATAAVGSAPQDHEDDRLGQARLFELLLGVFERAAGSSPAVVVLEDVQWADRTTLDLLRFLVQGTASTRILFVISARTEALSIDDEVRAFVAELERAGATRLELPPLDGAALRRFVDAALGGSSKRAHRDAIAARCGGNPFFAEQLVAASRDGIDPQGGLPPALRDVVASRLATLSTSTRRVLRVAAAGGRRIDDLLIARVADLPADEVADALREAVAGGLLVEADADVASGGEGTGGYAFRHALLQEGAYRELLPGERAGLHAAWASALEGGGRIGGVPGTAAEIALHWVAAHEPRRALPALVLAGAAARRMYAFEEAHRHFEAAIGLWDAVPAAETVVGRDRSWLAHQAAEAAMLAGDAARAVTLGREAVDHVMASSPADERRLGELHGRLRWFLWEAGEQDAARAALDEALRLIPEDPPSAARARALAQLAGIHLQGGAYGAAADAAARALRQARAASAVGEEALALGILGWARAVLGDVDAGVALFRDGLRIARRLGGPEGIALGYSNLASLLDRLGRVEAALDAALEGVATVAQLGLARTYAGTLLGHAAKALFNLGRWDEMASILERSFALDPVGSGAVWLHLNAARLATNRGEWTAAEQHLAGAHQAGVSLGGAAAPVTIAASFDSRYATAALAAGAELAVLRADVASLRAAVAEGLRYATDDALPDPWLAWLAALALRGEADSALGARARRDERSVATGRAVVEAVVAHLERFATVATGGRDAAIWSLCRAELERFEGRSSPSSWRAVAEAWASVGRPHPVAYARYRAGEAELTVRGDRRAAEGDLKKARAISTTLGAGPLLAEIEQLARQARLKTDDAARPDESAAASGGIGDRDPLGLTPRESEVLALLAAGWSNQQIADRLFVTRKTASVHVSNVLGKLGADNRVAAAAIAHRLGLATAEPPPAGQFDHASDGARRCAG
jgi:DNA-binding CsgD family transcriptional regulator